MIRNKEFEIVNIAEDYLAIPVGEQATAFHGVVALSEAAAFLLRKLDEPQTAENLVDMLLSEYEVDRATAEKDVESILKTFLDLRLIINT